MLQIIACSILNTIAFDSYLIALTACLTSCKGAVLGSFFSLILYCSDYEWCRLMVLVAASQSTVS